MSHVDTSFYLAQKLAQLQKSGAKTSTGANYTTVQEVAAAFANAGLTAAQHFTQFGQFEGLSPNANFDVAQYYGFKANQLNATNVAKPGGGAWTALDVELNFIQSKISAWNHFVQFGFKEGVNPSNAFDLEAYYASKAANLNSKGSTNAGAAWTGATVKAFFISNNIEPISHFIDFGRTEGVTVTAVAPANQVAGGSNASVNNNANVGQTFALTTGTDTLTGTTGNDTFLATAATTSPTFNAADTINGGAGTDVLNLTVDALAANSVPGATTTAIETINVRSISGNAQTIAAGNFSGATSVVSDRSTDALTVNGLVNGQTVGVIGNASVTNGASTFNYATGATATTVAISGGTVGAGAITLASATPNVLAGVTVTSTGAANTVGAVALGGAATTLTVNATTNLTTGGFTGFGGTTAAINVSGAATTVALGTIENNTVATVNASGLTAGGITATLSTSATIAVTGGAGNDTITTGAALTTGSVAAGAGAADRLVLGNDAHINSLTLGGKYSGFEVVSVGAGGTTIDLDLLAANNTLNGLVVTGSATATNINAATAANVTVTANNTSTLGVKGALTPGQTDTVNLLVNDGQAAVNTITITTPTIAGVEVLGINATDNATVTSLQNALALTTVNVTGAAATSITTTGIALQTNFKVDAAAATGNLTFNATGATTNGFSVIGSSGINTITGGNQIFSSNLSASTAKADVITLTNATGGTTALANATITGFTNSATVSIGDKLDVIGTAAIQANVAAGTATGVTNLTGAVTNGIMTFAGTAAATATLADKINAAASANFAGAVNEVIAFEHQGSTYVVSQQATADAFNAGADLLVQLTGVTGVTALSTTASGVNTVWVA